METKSKCSVNGLVKVTSSNSPCFCSQVATVSKSVAALVVNHRRFGLFSSLASSFLETLVDPEEKCFIIIQIIQPSFDFSHLVLMELEGCRFWSGARFEARLGDTLGLQLLPLLARSVSVLVGRSKE